MKSTDFHADIGAEGQCIPSYMLHFLLSSIKTRIHDLFLDFHRFCDGILVYKKMFKLMFVLGDDIQVCYLVIILPEA